jgi:hypothetical protein
MRVVDAAPSCHSLPAAIWTVPRLFHALICMRAPTGEGLAVDEAVLERQYPEIPARGGDPRRC